MEGNFMCAKCTLPIDLPRDSHLCQACTDERDLKEIDGLIDNEKREVDCLVVQMADCDILRAQYERDQPTRNWRKVRRSNYWK